jgi:hypothetical protein
MICDGGAWYPFIAQRGRVSAAYELSDGGFKMPECDEQGALYKLSVRTLRPVAPDWNPRVGLTADPKKIDPEKEILRLAEMLDKPVRDPFYAQAYPGAAGAASKRQMIKAAAATRRRETERLFRVLEKYYADGVDIRDLLPEWGAYLSSD